MTPARSASALGLLALVLIGTIALEVLAGLDNRTAPVAGSRAAVNVARSAELPRQELDLDLQAILARPVFSPDRRPVGAATHGVPGLARLSGIVVAGRRHFAIFAAADGGRPVVAEEGNWINAFQVVAITNAGVTVKGPDGTSVVMPAFGAPRDQPVRPLAQLRQAPPSAEK